MPRAPRFCSRVGCRKTAPCREHPRGWASSRSPALPANWKKLVKIVKSRKFCALSKSSVNHLGDVVDHVICRAWGGGHDISNLQLLCGLHHSQKTQEESAWGNKHQVPDLEWWIQRWT